MKPTLPLLPPIDEITEKTSLKAEREATDKISLEQLKNQMTAKTATTIVPKKSEEVTEKLNIKMVSAREYKNQQSQRRQTHDPLFSELLVKQKNLWQRIDVKLFKERLINVLRMIKFQHSIFALPFALTSAFLSTSGRPQTLDLTMIVLAMVTARNAAMSFNRFVDADIDKLNPRTKNREIPSGVLSKKFSLGFCLTNSVFFILLSSYFNILTLILSPIALTIILGYSLAKRFTPYTHLILGLALGITPLAAWIALTGKLALTPFFLSLAVIFWVAGFDIIYATLDEGFDRQHGVKSLVVTLGLKNSLILSKIFHALTFIFFLLICFTTLLSWFYFLGCLIVAALLAYEHSLVKPTDLSRVNKAFFTLNGFVSIIYFAFTLLDIYF